MGYKTFKIHKSGRTKMQVAGQEVVNYGYDADSRLTAINTLINSVAQGFSLSYDALGRRTSLTLPNGITTNYTYDNASRLLNLEHLNPLNQILEKINYAYDNNGNLTSKGNTTYTWDARNRLIAITSPSLTASFKYDSFGRRIEKTVNGRTIQYLYDGMDIVQEIEGGTVSANYIRTLNIDEPLARIKADGIVRYYQTDALGSVIALTDENGLVKTQYTYDPFGNTTINGETSDNPFQFAGRENDETGLLYERNRYYNFELQRYISQDPIGFAGGDVNFYVRVGNSPVNATDPLGLFDYNAPYPTTWPLPKNTADKVSCLEKCLGIPLIVTGGAEPTHSGGVKGPHGRGEATDFSFKRNPKLPGMKKKFMCCAKKCGFSFAQEESTPPHYHIQTGTGEDGSTGELPTSCGDC